MDVRAPDFLELLSARFAERRKALRHITPELLETDGLDENGRKLEFESVQGLPHTSVRLIVWEDRWCFVDARSKFKNRSWTWEFTREGRSLASADRLVQSFEDSI